MIACGATMKLHRNIRVQYLKIWFSSFGKEDFQSICIKLSDYVQIVFGYYFADNAGGATV